MPKFVIKVEKDYIKVINKPFNSITVERTKNIEEAEVFSFDNSIARNHFNFINSIVSNFISSWALYVNLNTQQTIDITTCY